MLKLTNAMNSKVNKQQVGSLVVLGIVDCQLLIVVLALLMLSKDTGMYFLFLFAFLLSILFFIINVAYYNKIRKSFHTKTTSPIKYIIFNEQTFEIIQVDNFFVKYNKNDIVKVNLDIKTAWFKPPKAPHFKAPEKIIASFKMKDSQIYSIEIIEIQRRGFINIVCNLMDMLSKQTEFDYKFSGDGFEQDFDEHIKTYKTKGVRLLMIEKDRKDCKALSLVVLLGGLGICILLVLCFGTSSWIEFLVFIKMFLIFVGISGLIYIPVLIDERNLRNSM